MGEVRLHAIGVDEVRDLFSGNPDAAARLTDLVESLTADRAAARVGERVVVLVDELDEDTGEVIGRAEHQGPDVDGVCLLPAGGAAPGELLAGVVESSEGVDLRVGVRA